jgi:hypothetical protein
VGEGWLQNTILALQRLGADPESQPGQEPSGLFKMLVSNQQVHIAHGPQSRVPVNKGPEIGPLEYQHWYLFCRESPHNFSKARLVSKAQYHGLGVRTMKLVPKLSVKADLMMILQRPV